MEFTRQELERLLVMASVYRQNEERLLRKVRRNIDHINSLRARCVLNGIEFVSAEEQIESHKNAKAEALVLIKKIKLGLTAGK